MSEIPASDQRHHAAANAASSAYQGANRTVPQSSYLPNPSFGNEPGALPHIAIHSNAHLLYPSVAPTNMDQISFLMGMRSILEECGTKMTPEVFSEQLREYFPPSRLLHPSVLKNGSFHKKTPSINEKLRC